MSQAAKFCYNTDSPPETVMTHPFISLTPISSHTAGAILMMLSTPQTNATSGTATYFAGLSPTSFIRGYSPTGGMSKLRGHNFEIFDGEPTPITAIPDTIEASPWKKRYLTCLLAMYMPADGVDENLVSALECWNFYVDQPSVPTITSARPRTQMVRIVDTHTSPGMAFED